MADPVVTAPASYKQPSRKGKRAWRKNVDLSEVQQGLDDVREEIIQGGIVAEKPSDELFATDLTGDVEVAKNQPTKKLLKVDEILAQRSAVPGLDGRKRKAKEDALSMPLKKQRANGKYVPHKDLQRLREVADNAAGSVAVEEGTATHDPWAVTKIVQDPRFSFLEEKKPLKEPNTLKQAPKSLAMHGKQVPNVRKPDAGKSYNPLVGDWTALLEREGAAAVEQEKQRLAAEAADAEKDARRLEEAAKVDAAERAEYGTDYDSAWESEWDGFQSENEEVFTQKQKKRKTPSERNKVKARKEREAREKADKKNNQRAADEKRIKQIAREVSEKDKARRAHITTLQRTNNDGDSSASEAEDVALQRRRFGKPPVPDAPLEVVLPDELEDSLRRLKPEGNLMEERYRNLLINGKLEVRKKRWQYKQPKTTSSEKWSYKDWKLR